MHHLGTGTKVLLILGMLFGLLMLFSAMLFGYADCSTKVNTVAEPNNSAICYGATCFWTVVIALVTFWCYWRLNKG